ncbi:MAG: Smr/MutS family protein [Caulobacteraceae bacterium]|nr:Smr/MutS family protein [Caulobacteraceae bacterium]
MRRPLRPEEANLWARVAATVRLAPGREAPKPPKLVTPDEAAPIQRTAHVKPAPRPQLHRHHGAPDAIEPRRLRRITREREELGPRIDLHGMTQDRARVALEAFLRRASEDGWRAVLVITGKGTSGDGVLRRRAPDWLAEPAIRALVAGVSEAHRRHGGKGALYVTLKRRSE